MFDFLFSKKQLARIVKVERAYDATRAREFVDLIVSNNCFAHIKYMNGVVRSNNHFVHLV